MNHHLLKYLVLSIFALANLTLHAQIPNGYYNNAEGKSGNELKIALHNIIKNHKSVSYNGLLNAFAYTDSDSNSKVWDIYSNCHYSFNSNCGSYDEEGDCWNREHTWPQSWFNEQTTPRCDLFHVYPTDGFVNGKRSNYPYGEVNKPTYTSGNGSKLGPCVTSGYSGIVFEPIDEYKGDIARSYFYMSVRYYGEDSGWSSSGMTNKSTILDWAMTMLLRWSDEDPVSDKEIARNNAVYGYQNNRNPFIDHPEYARMIWDPNYTPANAYEIMYASGLANGSVTGPESANEGSTVAITAIPAAGYMVDSYNVHETDSPSTSITVSSNGTFTMPGCNVTVSATFKVNNTYYAISTAEATHGSISVSNTSAKSGTTITMNATPDEGYSLYSWYVYKTGDINTVVYYGTNGTFTMPAFDVTVLATFSTQGSAANGDFVKVTESLNDWSGEYLIVYEDGELAFNGGLTTLDAVSNTINVSINGNTIEATPENVAARFTIAQNSNQYTIQSASGYYIGATGNTNSLNSSTTTAYTNSISYDNGEVNIIGSGGAYLRYNKQSGQNRFRYFKSSTYNNQQAIQLYRRASTVTAPTHTIHFNSNGGEGAMDDQTAEEFVPTAITTNSFTREGFEFDGWNTQADGEGTYYSDNANITLTDDITLYAQWDPKYAITLNQPAHGTISANFTAAIAETTVTLSITPDPGYELASWSVTNGNGNPVMVTENQFEMPADEVTVSAQLNYVGVAQIQYQLVTATDQLVAGETYLIVNIDNSKALSTTQNNNNRGAAEVTIADDVIPTISTSVCELTLGGETSAWTLFDPNYGSTGGYLYAASSSSNHLKTQTTLTDDGKWDIGITSEGVATLTAQGNNSRNLLKYNQQNNLFSCYANGQLAVALFRRVEIHEGPSEQTITLAQGWNWWSTYLDITLEQLEEALGDDGITINAVDNTTVMYESGLGWAGNLTTINPAHMYQIEMANAREIILSGQPVNSEEHPITINPGINWIGYPVQRTMTVTEALANYTPAKNDVIKSKNGTSVYSGTTWTSNWNLEPGEGYIYISKASSTSSFTYPAR